MRLGRLAIAAAVAVAACSSRVEDATSPSTGSSTVSVGTASASLEGGSADVETCEPVDPTVGTMVGGLPAAGEVVWSFRPNTGNQVSPLTSAVSGGGVVFVGASDVPGGHQGTLYALDAADGSVVWVFDHGGHTPSTPTLADGLVLFGSEDHHVYAVDEVDGTEVWRFETGGHVRSKPAVFRDHVLVSSQDGHVYSFGIADGVKEWQYRFDEPMSDSLSRGSIPPSPAVGDGVAFVGARNGILTAIEVSTGEVRWEYDVGSQIFVTPSVGSDVVFVSDISQHLYAIDTDDGHLRWAIETDGSVISSVFATSIFVYAATTTGLVYAIDICDGVPLWETHTASGRLGSPVVEDDVLYVASNDGLLLSIDAQDGSILTTYQVGSEINRKPHAVAQGVFYVVTQDRYLHAINMKP